MIILDKATETTCCNCGTKDDDLVGLNICHKIYPINSICLCKDCLSMLRDMIDEEIEDEMEN